MGFPLGHYATTFQSEVYAKYMSDECLEDRGIAIYICQSSSLELPLGYLVIESLDQYQQLEWL